jgi:peptide/nickel transport system permease protein
MAGREAPRQPAQQSTFVLKRVLYAVPAIAGLLILAFVISRIIPADPASLVAGEMASPQQVEEIRRQHGFDRPLHVQILLYFSQLLKGDLGKSLYTGRSVFSDLIDRFPATLELTFVSMFLSIAVGIPLGIAAALKRNSSLDHILRGFTVAGWQCSFWLSSCPLFGMDQDRPFGEEDRRRPPATIFGLYLINTYRRSMEKPFWRLKHPYRPLHLSLYTTITHFTRSGGLDVIQETPFFITCRGLLQTRDLQCLLRNALISTVTQIEPFSASSWQDVVIRPSSTGPAWVSMPTMLLSVRLPGDSQRHSLGRRDLCGEPCG